MLQRDEFYFSPFMSQADNRQPQAGDLLDVVIDSTRDGIYITDGRANTLRVNNSYEMISGLNRAEVIGRNMHDLVDEGIISASGTLAVLESKKPVTMEQVFKTGRHAVITSNPVFDADGDICLVVTNVQDITELYNIRRELQKRDTLTRKYRRDLESMQDELAGSDNMLAVDPKMLSVLKMAKRLAGTKDTVLITGDSGAGKEQLARYIHLNSEAAVNAFVKLDLKNNLPASAEQTLFGQMGDESLVELVDGGTLFIKEISNMPRHLQQRITLLLEEGGIHKGERFVPISFKIIATSTRPLPELEREGIITSPWLEQLSLFPIHVPRLAERADDIIPFADFFLTKFNQMYGTNKRFSHEMISYMQLYKWPGNVRELRNFVQRAVILSEVETIRPSDMFMNTEINHMTEGLDDMPERVNLKELVEQLEASYMTRAFQKTGNSRDAAKILSMDSSTFVRKRQKYLTKGAMEK